MDSEGLRSTEQRRAVTEEFFRSKGHLTIDDLLAQVRKENPKVGYATVYRTLKMLADSGVANERHFNDGLSRYEIAHLGHHHDHLICTECDAILEFEDEEIERLQEELARKKGFQLTRHKHELYGHCISPKYCRKDKK